MIENHETEIEWNDNIDEENVWEIVKENDEFVESRFNLFP